MPRHPHTARRRTPAPAAVARAALAVGAGLAAIPLAAAAPAGAATAGHSAASAPLKIVISSVTPGYVKPGQTVKVSGWVTNSSGKPMTDPSIQLASATQPFSSRTTLQQYDNGATASVGPVHGAADVLHGKLRPSATRHWSIKVPVKRLRLASFGVYPLVAQAQADQGRIQASGRTFLPFWPGRAALDPAKQRISWIWPLVDQPQQTACSGLASTSLAASLTTGGRLDSLLTAGAQYATAAHLTWAVDPALLADAQTMAKPYRVSSGSVAVGCAAKPYPGSDAAQDWLSALKTKSAGQDMFLTPYADPDAVALIHRGLNADLSKAFTEGRAVAGTILGRNFTPRASDAQSGSDAATLSSLAWPPDGVANYPTLQSLAGVDGISSVLLNSTTMPSSAASPPTPGAQTTTPDGEGPDLHVLVSDHTLTSALGSAGDSRAPGSGFAIRQYFLAQTAMIAAEAPQLGRSIVVAPPSRWDPSASVARGLLAETVRAPWLRPVSAASLITGKQPADAADRKLSVPASATKGSLSASLLHRVRITDQRVALLQSVQQQPDTALSYATAAVESSAWRGGRAAARPAWQRLEQISAYVKGQESKLMLVGPARVTLGGLKGTVPVSVANHLKYPVQVRLRVVVPSGGSITVRSQTGLLKLDAGAVETVKIAVSTAAVGSTSLRLSLQTPQGAALPAKPVVMDVQATHYGTLALIIIAAALGVFMLTSATKAMRRGRGTPPAGPVAAAAGTGQTEDSGPAAEPEPVPTGPGPGPGQAIPDPAAPPATGPQTPPSQTAAPPITGPSATGQHPQPQPPWDQVTAPQPAVAQPTGPQPKGPQANGRQPNGQPPNGQPAAGPRNGRAGTELWPAGGWHRTGEQTRADTVESGPPKPGPS
jgi:hypothetical protein